MAYDTGTLAQTSVLNVTANGINGALWGSGGGPAHDSSGNIYVMVANGTFDATLNANGFPYQGNFGNGFLKLAWFPGNKLRVRDYFASFDAANGAYNESVELGSSSPLVLPDMVDANGQVRHLAAGAGKLGTIFVVDRDNMGKFNPTAGNSNVYQQVAGALGPGGDGDAVGAVRMPPVFFNNLLYFAANHDPIHAFQFTNAKLSELPFTSTGRTFGYPGAALSISANGNTNGILWAAAPGAPAAGGGLYAFDARNLHQELYNSNEAGNGRDQFSYSKFAPPTIANGMVYVTTPSGVVSFGLR